MPRRLIILLIVCFGAGAVIFVTVLNQRVFVSTYYQDDKAMWDHITCAPELIKIDDCHMVVPRTIFDHHA